MYSCIAEPPFWVEAPASQVTALVGEDTVLVCRAGGDPAPRVSWRGPGRAARTAGQELRLANLHPSDQVSFIGS